ncbi:MAG: HEAT repeat domain-containing protein [Phycisphaerales bacterium]|nr:MAG: HEAT repeat domain-containing protein [Phycisphaerales bacterium]
MRRTAILLMVAICGLIGGAIAWPAIRTGYYARMARSADASRRIEAMNVLGSLCVRDPSGAGDLVDAVLNERTVGSLATRRLADEIAVWTLARCEAVLGELVRRLPDADDETFLHVADLLRRGGHWRRPERSWDVLAGREILRLRADDPATRLAALRALAELGPGVSDLIVDPLTGWLRDGDVAVRVEVVRTASVCLGDEATRSVLSRGLRDAAGVVRREAVIRSALRGVSVPLELLNDDDAQVRESAAWALGVNPVPPAASALLQVACSDSRPEVQAMAAWALGHQEAAPSGPAPAAFLRMANTADAALAARVMVAAGRQGKAGWARQLYDTLAAVEPAPSPDAAMAFVFACGRTAPSSSDGSSVVRSLWRVVEESLRTGYGALAAVACEALASLDDQPFVPVLQGIARDMDDQPMLQYTAAAAALRLDREVGVEALLGLLDGNADAVCDLAAIRLGQVAEPPVERLVQKLVDGDERTRASAALALAFAGAGDVDVAGERLDAYLRRRTDPNAGVYEQAWKPNGYSLCALLVLGEAGQRERLVPFIRNEHFPRFGLYAALLHCGDPLPMDLLLSRASTIDVESFLCDARFIEIIADHFPDAPSFGWFEDSQLRAWQIDRLREWWSIKRWAVKK